VYNADYLHESGKLPTRYYNQLNDKPAHENYKRLKMSHKKKDENILLSFIQGMLHETMKAALNEIFKELRFDK
jgi:ribosomal protein L13